LTLIIVTHDAGVASYCHRVVRLHDGRIAADQRQSPAAIAKESARETT
jgi:ABC-type lipoprotein export system ATPase subunit